MIFIFLDIWFFSGIFSWSHFATFIDKKLLKYPSHVCVILVRTENYSFQPKSGLYMQVYLLAFGTLSYIAVSIF